MGALDLFKRPESFLRAVGRLKRGSAVLIGNGPLFSRIHSMGRQILGEKRFLMKKGVPYHEMPKWYRSCDVFSLPSSDEPFGNSAIEALACGKPVVVNDSPIIKWVVEEAGLYCNCGNIEEYSNHLKLAYENRKNLTKMAERSLKKFNWESIIETYIQEIEAITQRKNKIDNF